MKFYYKLERKLGKYAIPHLMTYIIGCYIIGYVLLLSAPALLNYLTLEPYLVLRGQIWRLFTWVLVPSSGFSIIFTAIMLLFYYQLGTQLEYYWGTFKFNLYMFEGLIFTNIAAFILYGISCSIAGSAAVSVGGLFSTYYINMSLFLAFATCFPEMEVRLYFIIPVKMKWMGVVYGALLIYSLATSNWAERTAIFASLLNFVLFFFSTRNWQSYSPKQVKRRAQYKRQVHVNTNATKHKCAICGRTEKDDPTLEFRYCSKCDGNYEYCQEHLFTHQHIKRG